MMRHKREQVNREIRKLSQSFHCAFRGVAHCMQTERNFRIHLSVAAYVGVFALIGNLPSVQLAILCLCFALMLGAELMNTAIERLCDRNARGYDGVVRDAKDIAAGAVLICALFCVVIGVALFICSGALERILAFFVTRTWASGLFVLSIPACLVFIFKERFT